MGVLSNKIERKELIPGDHIYTWRSAYLYSHHGFYFPRFCVVWLVFMFVAAENLILGSDSDTIVLLELLSGIFVGDDMVIHFTRAVGQETGTGTFLDRIMVSSSPSPTGRNLCERCGDQSRLHGVIMSCLDCFLSGGNLYLFCYAVTPVFFFTKARGGTCTLAHSDPPDVVLSRARYLHDNNGFGMYNIFKNNCEDFAIYCKTGLLVETSFSVGRSGQISSLTAAFTAIASSPLRFLTTTPVGLVVVSSTMYCVGRYVSDIGIRRDAKAINVETLVAQMHTGEVPETTGTAAVNSN